MKIHLDADEINEMLSEFPDNEHFVTQEQLNRPAPSVLAAHPTRRRDPQAPYRCTR